MADAPIHYCTCNLEGTCPACITVGAEIAIPDPVPARDSPAVELESEIPAGELRARWREQHLCTRCQLATLCKHAIKEAEPLFIIISQCVAHSP